MSLKRELSIKGMTCDHCALTIKKALDKLPGVEAEVSYPEAKVWIDAGKSVEQSLLIRTIQEAGYEVEKNGDNPLSVAIIGSGSAAFAAAIHLDSKGARVTMIERETLGGTCVNIGCVPSKIFIRQADVVHRTTTQPFPGIKTSPASIDFQKLRAQQEARVDELREAKYAHILEIHPNIRLINGNASFTDPNTIRIEGTDGTVTDLHADNVLIATGVRPTTPPIPGLSGTPFWTSTDALEKTTLPDHLVIIGGGFVACELGQAYLRLGSKVTLLQRGGRILSSFDPDVATGLETVFREEGMDLRTNTRVDSVSHDGSLFTVTTDQGILTSDALLVVTGRTPNTDTLNLKAAGVNTDDRGQIPVDSHLRTNVSHIFAAGDVTPLAPFVYVAAKSGTIAAKNMVLENDELDLSLVPEVVFCDPVVASVGITEENARARGIDVDVRILTLDNVPRSLANFYTKGLIKLIAERETGRLLGAHLLADQAGEMIQVAHLAIHFNMTTKDLGDRLFPYLTMSEGLKLAAQTFSRDVSTLSCCAG